ncbi:WD40 repeat domain-containing protein [bacterium]|nr:MAG: WD40 repeat domain-containing protein [bacterium]
MLLLSPLVFVALAGGIWTLQRSGPATLSLPGSAYVNHFKFSPDGKRLVVFADQGKPWTEQGHVFELENRTEICKLAMPKLQGSTSRMYSYHSPPSWSPDGTRIVAGYNDDTFGNTPIPLLKPRRSGAKTRRNMIGKFAMWNAEAGTLLGTHFYAPVNENSRGGVRYSDDGKRLFGYGSPPSFFDPTTGRRTERLWSQIPVSRHAAFNEKSGLLALTDEYARQFQVVDTRAKRVVWSPPISGVNNLDWDGDILAISSREISKGGKGWGTSHLVLWDSRNHKTVASQTISPPNVIGEVLFRGDGQTLLYTTFSLSTASSLVLWNYRENRILWNYKAKSNLRNAQWSPDKNWISVGAGATTDAPEQVLVFAHSGTLGQQIKASGDAHSWSPDSQRLAVLQREDNKDWQIGIVDVVAK